MTSIFCVELISDFIDSLFSTTDQSSSKTFFFKIFDFLNLLKIALILNFFFRSKQFVTMCFISLHLWQMKCEWFVRFRFFSSMFFRRFFVFILSINEFLFSRLLFLLCFLLNDVLKFNERLLNVVWTSIVFFMLFFKRFVKINNFFLMMNRF